MLRSQHPEAVRNVNYTTEDSGQQPRRISPQRGNFNPINFDDPSPLPPATAYFSSGHGSNLRHSHDAGSHAPKYISEMRGAADEEPPRPLMPEDLAMME
jgi:hypothetical protein